MSKAKNWATLHPFLEAGDVLGRKVANSGFLSALLKADPFDAYYFFLEDQPLIDHLNSKLRQIAPHIAQRQGFHLHKREQLATITAMVEFHCFHLSDTTSDTVPLMRLRNALAKNIFPITGTTHSLSYERFMPAWLGLLSPTTTSKDAVIATSSRAKAMLQATFEGLRQGYNLSEEAYPGPQLPVIPLGVDPEDFPKEKDWCRAGSNPRPTAAGKAIRQRLGIGKDEIVFLCLARISPHSKMDIMPIIAAFQRAASLGAALEKCCMVLAGWADEDDKLPQSLAQYAKTVGLKLIPVLRPDDADRFGLYAAADCFLSPSDNIQETFGLTIIEAGASGLPVIASDFDGYKDLIEPEKTGLLIPCTGFSTSSETDALAGIWRDNQYHLRLAQQTAVHVPELSKAIARLCLNREERESLGKAGRERVLEFFSWDKVVQGHVSLWGRLAQAEIAEEKMAGLRRNAHPMQMNFSSSFRAHFSATLAESSGLALQRTPRGEAVYRKALPPVLYAGMEEMLGTEDIHKMLLAARKPIAVADLLKALSREGKPFDREHAEFLVLWALKHDYLEPVT